MNREVARVLSRSPEMKAYDQIMTGLSLLARGAMTKVTVEGADGQYACIEIPESLAVMSLRRVKIDTGHRLDAAKRLAEQCFVRSLGAKRKG